jgi:formylglycine-generating enzyme required for sulfatase activity
MSVSFLRSAGAYIVKFLGTPVRGSKAAGEFIAVATLSTAQTLLELLRSRLASDIGRLKEARIRASEAETRGKDAEAEQKLAEAARAANEATHHKRRDAEARIERERRKAEVEKTRAETDAARMDAETRRMDAETRRLQAIAEAKARLMEALSGLRQQGGEAFFSEQNLREIIQLGIPQQEMADEQNVATPPGPAAVGGAQVTANSIGMHLALIPAGSFLMGSSVSQHPVRISKPFLLGVYPVTQQEYEQVMRDNPSYFKGDGRLPVEGVSWFDAVDFCNQLSEMEGRKPYYRRHGNTVSIAGGDGYRLPTEAEWEYACRAGTTREYSFGDDPGLLHEYGWFRDNSDGRPQPVGAKKSNPWGLYDMHGNVWEWCWDWYAEYSSDEVTDPTGPEEATYRVNRGGCWASGAEYCRSACRGRSGPTSRYQYLGFRLATVPPGQSGQGQATG